MERSYNLWETGTMSLILQDQVALVTGGSQGIGRACALALVAQGATVCVASRNKDKLEAVVAEILAAGGRAIAVALDVGSADSVEAGFKRLFEMYPRLDILVNNAAITRDGLAMRMKNEDWDAVLQTNLSGTFFCCREALPAMIKARYGRIVNITSVVAQSGNPGQANYVASKAGIIGLTRSLAKEVASRKITVNAVSPGFIDTEMTRILPASAKERMLEMIPLGRMGHDTEVAHAVEFLASPLSSYITGQVLNVNGGLYM